MPSGAKKRKAAKKKLQKVHHNNENDDGSHTSSDNNNNKGSDDPKCYDESEGKVADVGLNNHDGEGAKELSLGEGNVEGEVKQQEESFEGVIDNNDDDSREFDDVTTKSSSNSSSGSSSSSDDDEVIVEKEEPVETEIEKEEASVEEAVVNAVEESIPMDELIKQVVSLPLESTIVSESVPVEHSSTSDVIETGLKQYVDEGHEVLQPSDDKLEVASEVIGEIEEKVIPAVDGGSLSTSESVGVTVRNGRELLPQPCGVKAVEGCYEDNNGRMPETQKYTEEQPLLPPAPLTVRRTSWMDCCGLFEVLSGDPAVKF